MNKEDRKNLIEQEIVKCSRCGNCRSICPVFLAENNENTTPRSKSRLLEAVVEGEIELTPGVQKRFEKCLLCKACKVHCGSGVATDKLIIAGRTAAAKKNGIPLMKKIAFTSLRYRNVFDLCLRTGAVFQKIAFKKIPGKGLVPRITMPSSGLSNQRILPEIAVRPFRANNPPVIEPVGKSKGIVVFFTGCTVNYIYPKTGEAVVNILKQNGWTVVIPSTQCCCGTPTFTSGDERTGIELAEKNVQVISAVQNADFVVTACASCGAALKEEYGELLKDSSSLKKWEKLSSKVLDISQFVNKYCDLEKLGTLDHRVTYHDPCHLVRGMNVSDEPRAIIKSIPGIQYVEMTDANRCCGAGGSFSAVYYEVSRKINDKKLDNAEATGAKYLVTGCSSCRMHITDGLSQRNSDMKVLHTAELINMAYEVGGKESIYAKR